MAVSSLLRFGPFTCALHTGALGREAERLPLPLQEAAARPAWLQPASRAFRKFITSSQRVFQRENMI